MGHYPATLPLPAGFQRFTGSMEADGAYRCIAFDDRQYTFGVGRQDALDMAEDCRALLDGRSREHYWSKKTGPQTFEVVAAPDGLDPQVAQIVQAQVTMDDGYHLVRIGNEVATQGLSRFNALVMAADWLACQHWLQGASTWARWKGRERMEILLIRAAQPPAAARS